MTTGLHNLNIATAEEVEALRRRIDELAARVEQLAAALAESAPARGRRDRGDGA